MNISTPMNYHTPLKLLTCLPALIIPVLALAQTPDFRTPIQSANGGEPGTPPPLIELWLDTSYTAAGNTTFRGAKSGDSDAFSVSLSLSSRAPLNEKWMIPLGLLSQSVFLDSVAGTPVPDRIHMLRFSTGLGRRLNDQWMVMALVSPTLYKFDDIGANDFGISGGLTAMWNYSPSLTFMFGLMVASDSDRPVMPALGVNWAINEMLDLNLMFPRPRLVYRPDEHLSLHLGVDMKRATFRTSDTLGTSIGLPQYNDALGNYRDIRLGAGVDYTFTHSLSVEAEAGYSVNRQIDYTQIDERVEFDPAPYFRLGVKVSF